MARQKGRTGLDNRYEDLNGRIDLKRSDAVNKNLPHPIPQFSPNATVGHMREVTGKQGLRAIAKAARKMRGN
jgi:Tfp pilus assembly protein FimT